MKSKRNPKPGWASATDGEKTMSWTDWQQVEGDGMDFDEILYDKKHHTELEGGIARITMNKPEKYNAMAVSTVEEMFRAFYEANHDPSIGVIVVAGAVVGPGRPPEDAVVAVARIVEGCVALAFVEKPQAHQVGLRFPLYEAGAHQRGAAHSDNASKRTLGPARPHNARSCPPHD